MIKLCIFCIIAERTDPSPFDVLQAFNQLDISIESLEAYFEKVEAPQLPGTPPPLLPVPVSQGKHVHNVTSRKVCHKKGHVSREEGSAGEGEEEEEEEESEEDEIIPVHLPPLPLMTKDKEGTCNNTSVLYITLIFYNYNY